MGTCSMLAGLDAVNASPVAQTRTRLVEEFRSGNPTTQVLQMRRLLPHIWMALSILVCWLTSHHSRVGLLLRYCGDNIN